MRKRRPIDRKAGVVRDASLVVIASEDRYAARQYFDFFESTRIQFKVLEADGGRSAPAQVLARLDEYFKDYAIGDGDEFWLVCDCDHWVAPNHIQNLTTVLRECRQKGIRVALSNPCFDLWLLLHFSDVPDEDELTCKAVGKKLQAVAGGYDKTKVYNLAITDRAVRDAVARSAAHQPCSGEIPDRPQTALHLIVQSLLERGIIAVRDAPPDAPPKKRKQNKPKK
jgi:RloB-like protein